MSSIIFDSASIKMFPSQNRSDQFDRKARFATDVNIANLTMALTTKQGFVLNGCVVNSDKLTLTGNDSCHSIWLAGCVFNIEIPVIDLPTTRTAGGVLQKGDIAAFYVKWVTGADTLSSGRIGVNGQLEGGDGTDNKYTALQLLTIQTIPSSLGDFYAPVAVWNGSTWGAYETARHNSNALDITITPNIQVTEPLTGYDGEQSVSQYFAFNSNIDDGGLNTTAGKNLNRLQLKRESHTNIVNNASANILDGEIIIDQTRNYLTRGKNGLPKNYQPIITNQVNGYASELYYDGINYIYTASNSPKGHYQLTGVSENNKTEVRLDVDQGTSWKIRRGTEDDIVGSNASVSPTITLNKSKLVLAEGLTVTGAPDFSVVNTAFNTDFNTNTSNVKKDGTVSVGTLDLTARADHVHPLNFTTTVPSALSIGNTASAGSSNYYTRRDHVHEMPKFDDAIKPDSQSGAGGAATTLARSDHQHQANVSSTTPTAITIGATGSAGETFVYARSDHAHASPQLVSTSTSGFMSSTDKTKLDGIAEKANNYTHPTATAYANGLYKITTNSTGHVTTASAVSTSDFTNSTLNLATKSDATYTAGTNITIDTNRKISLNSTLTSMTAITASGQITAASFCATSDRRLKENIKPANTKDITNVPVYQFNFKGDADKCVGIMAQDLQKDFPELVRMSDDDHGTLIIKESKLIYYLLDEVKRLKDELNELKKLIKA